MKKRTLTIIFALGLAVLVSVNAYPLLIEAKEDSDPFQPYYEQATPEIIPPKIQISSPSNNSRIDNTTFTLVFNVSVPQVVSTPPNVEARRSELNYVFYQGDWQAEKQEVYGHNYVDAPSGDDFFEFTNVVSNISEGTHSLVITAHGTVGVNAGVFGFDYHSESNTTIIFTVDSVNPSQGQADKELHLGNESTALLAIISIVVVVCVGVLIYRKRLAKKQALSKA